MEKYSEFIQQLRSDAVALNIMKWHGMANTLLRAADIIEELDYKYKKSLNETVKKAHK